MPYTPYTILRTRARKPRYALVPRSTLAKPRVHGFHFACLYRLSRRRDTTSMGTFVLLKATYSLPLTILPACMHTNPQVNMCVKRAVIDHVEQEGIGLGAVLMILNPEPWLSMVCWMA